ncbi:MAG: hypothetical protein ABIF08_03540 [Nanoarchaeota archaeon]
MEENKIQVIGTEKKKKDSFLLQLEKLAIIDPNEIMPGGSSMLDRSFVGEFTGGDINKRVKSLGYKPLGKALKSVVLAKLLRENGIKVFSNETVDEYMDNMLVEKNFVFNILDTITTVMYFGGVVGGILGTLSLIVLGICTLFGASFIPLVWNVLWPITIVSVVSFLATILFPWPTPSFWVWENVSLKKYQGHIPTKIIERAELINDKAKASDLSVVFEVHELRRMWRALFINPFGVVGGLLGLGDPFLSVRVKRSDILYYVGVWEESSFKGRSLLP